MRKAMGPILTTGVALVAAAVVVANPVVPPVRDLQISTTQLSTSPEALIPFDKNLLNAISQPSAVAGFNTALAQILGALAAEADRIGSAVTSGGSTAPVPTAAAQTPAVYTPGASEIEPAPAPNGTPAASSTLSQASAAASTPGIQQVVSDLAADTTYLGNKVVEAAYAAVNAIVNTPNLVIKAVQAFFKGDLPGALDAVIEAIKAFFNPGLILVGGIDNIFGQLRQPPTAAPVAAASVTPPESGETSMQPGPTAGETASDPAPTKVATPGTNKPREAKGTGSTSRRAPAQVDLTPKQFSAVAGSADQSQPGSDSPTGGSGTPSTPGTGNPSRSANNDRADRAEPQTPGADKPGPGSGRGPGAGGRGASASG